MTVSTRSLHLFITLSLHHALVSFDKIQILFPQTPTSSPLHHLSLSPTPNHTWTLSLIQHSSSAWFAWCLTEGESNLSEDESDCSIENTRCDHPEEFCCHSNWPIKREFSPQNQPSFEFQEERKIILWSWSEKSEKTKKIFSILLQKILCLPTESKHKHIYWAHEALWPIDGRITMRPLVPWFPSRNIPSHVLETFIDSNTYRYFLRIQWVNIQNEMWSKKWTLKFPSSSSNSLTSHLETVNQVSNIVISIWSCFICRSLQDY